MDRLPLWVLLALVILVIFLAPEAKPETVKLTWVSPQVTHDGVRVFSRIEKSGNDYDFNSPVKTDQYPDGNIPSGVNHATIDLPGEPLAVTRYFLVSRTYRGKLISENSNEAFYDVVRTKPAAPESLNGDYNPLSKTITLGWYQPEEEYPIEWWEIEYQIYDNPWSLLAIVEAVQDPFLKEALDVAENGKISYLYFRATAFRKSGEQSDPSKVFMVSIDLTDTSDEIDDLLIPPQIWVQGEQSAE